MTNSKALFSVKTAAGKPAELPAGTLVRRHVEYRVYVGLSPSGDSVVSDLDVMMCESEGDAGRRALAHRDECQQGKLFRKTVYLYRSGKVSWRPLFGYFVCKTMESKPEVFVDFNTVDYVDSKKPISGIWLRRDSINEDLRVA